MVLSGNVVFLCFLIWHFYSFYISSASIILSLISIISMHERPVPMILWYPTRSIARVGVSKKPTCIGISYEGPGKCRTCNDDKVSSIFDSYGFFRRPGKPISCKQNWHNNFKWWKDYSNQWMMITYFIVCPGRCQSCQGGPCRLWCSSSNWYGDSNKYKETDCRMCNANGMQ